MQNDNGGANPPPQAKFRVVTYNPMYITGAARAQEISTEFSNVGVLLLPGTARRQHEGGHSLYSHPAHWE
eukprot:7577160-Pyramimonas_sp.AAC.1